MSVGEEQETMNGEEEGDVTCFDGGAGRKCKVALKLGRGSAISFRSLDGDGGGKRGRCGRKVGRSGREKRIFGFALFQGGIIINAEDDE